MGNKLKLFLDEDIHPELAIILKNIGFDAVSTLEVKKCGSTDIEQMHYAISQGRALLTFNIKDFVILYKQFLKTKTNHYRIIVSSQLPLKEVLRRLITIEL